MQELRTLVLIPLAAALFSGCFIGTGPDTSEEPSIPIESTGTLTVVWTLANSNSASQCESWGAHFFELVVYDSSHNEVATTYAPCENFSTTLELSEGSYEAEGTLVDTENQSVTVTLPMHDVRIREGTDLRIDTDFPAGSVL